MIRTILELCININILNVSVIMNLFIVDNKPSTLLIFLNLINSKVT